MRTAKGFALAWEYGEPTTLFVGWRPTRQALVARAVPSTLSDDLVGS